MKRFVLCTLVLAGCSHNKSHDHHEHQEVHSHAHHEMHHRFENAEEWAKKFDDPARDAWQKPDEVVALMAIAPGARVVDLGAGTGYFLPYLSRAAGAEGSVLALDVEADMVRYMTERAAREGWSNVTAKQVAPNDPGLEAGSVDRLLIADTWHHIGDRGEYSKKLAAALKPGGALFILDFTLETEKGPPKKHRLTAEQVIAELETGGLKAAVLSENLPDQYVVRATRN